MTGEKQSVLKPKRTKKDMKDVAPEEMVWLALSLLCVISYMN